MSFANPFWSLTLKCETAENISLWGFPDVATTCLDSVFHEKHVSEVRFEFRNLGVGEKLLFWRTTFSRKTTSHDEIKNHFFLSTSLRDVFTWCLEQKNSVFTWWGRSRPRAGLPPSANAMTKRKGTTVESSKFWRKQRCWYGTIETSLLQERCVFWCNYPHHKSFVIVLWVDCNCLKQTNRLSSSNHSFFLPRHRLFWHPT